MKRESPVERFPGYVVLPEFLTLPQVRAFEEALGSPDVGEQGENERIWFSVIAEKRLPAILACVEEWHIENVPEAPEIDTFPMTPIGYASELINWLFSEISKIWMGEVADPKD